MMEQSQALDEDTTTTTSVEIVQLETFENIKFVIEKEDSRVSYLAPKQFLNSGLDIGSNGNFSSIISSFDVSSILKSSPFFIILDIDWLY